MKTKFCIEFSFSLEGTQVVLRLLFSTLSRHENRTVPKHTTKKSWRECIFQQLSADTLGFLWQQKDHLSPSAEIPLSYPFPSSAKIPIEGIGKFSFNFPELCICQCCPPMTMRTFWSSPKRHSSGWHEKNAICYLGRAVYCLTIVKKSYDGVFPWRYLKKKQHLLETSLCQHILSKP